MIKIMARKRIINLKGGKNQAAHKKTDTTLP
jgi:hypothetical protein